MAQYNEIRLGDDKSEVSIQIKIAFRTTFFHENPPKSGSVTKYFPYRYFKTAFNSAQLIKKHLSLFGIKREVHFLKILTKSYSISTVSLLKPSARDRNRTECNNLKTA